MSKTRAADGTAEAYCLVQLDGETSIGGDGTIGSGLEDGQPLGCGTGDERNEGEEGLHGRVSRGCGLR